MICETCQGRGRVPPPKMTTQEGFEKYVIRGELGPEQWPLCPDCSGSGQAHCCDGLREQPDATCQ